MIKIRIAKIAGIAAGATLVFGSFVPMAGAVTVSELQTQIDGLMAQLATLQGGSAMMAHQFNTNLTVGSRGADVIALQEMLVAGGHLVMPAGVAKGYFGSLTKAAVAKWQMANGVSPAVGFFGSITRAKLNGMVVTVPGTPGTTANCPTGWICTQPGGSITTPGAEGTLTVTTGTISNSTVYSGDVMQPILAFKAKATNSDIAIQRVKLDLGTISNIYSKVYSKVYLVNEAGQTLASSDLNSSTVVKDSDNRYYITIVGFSSVVPKDMTKNYTVKVDVRSVSSGSSDLTSHTVRLAANGVRGVDGAGVNQYSPILVTDVSKAVTLAATLSDSATLAISLSSATPLAREVVASLGSNNDESDKVVMLMFDVRAEKDNVIITDLVASTTGTLVAPGNTTASTTYLYDGDTLIGSGSTSGSDTTFTDINFTVPKGVTKTLTLKSDIRVANATQKTYVASVFPYGITAENSVGDTIGFASVTGSATGNNVLVRNVGPVFTLVSKAITFTPALSLAGATSTAKASFTVRIMAVGSDVDFGSSASTTFPLIGWGSTVAGTSTIIYLNGATTITTGIVQSASSTSLTFPSSGLTTLSSLNSYRLAKNNSVDVSVDYVVEGRRTDTAGNTYNVPVGAYAIGLERLNWLSSVTGRTTSTFMSGDTAWRTGTVVLP